MSKLKQKNRLKRLIVWSKRKRLKQFSNIPLYDLLKVFWIRVMKGNFPVRSGAIAWTLFFSLFPFILFLFSLLPKIPHYEELKLLLFHQFLPQIIPNSIGKEVIGYIDITTQQQEQKSVNWWFMIFTIFMSSNGVQGIINGFNVSYQDVFIKRNNNKQRLISLILTIFFTVFLILQLTLLYYTGIIWKYLAETKFFFDLSKSSRLINMTSVIMFYFLSMCMLYHYGPNNQDKSKSTVVPGAVLSTLLFITTLFGFNVYLKHFNNLDLLYGSLGLVMLVMIFVYVNVIILLVGYELNMSLTYAKNYSNMNKIQKNNFIELNLKKETNSQS
ncbi:MULTISPECIES: YihY/virulence factor BrkB family protein [Weeksella]|uniref:Ribonuclease BN n=1 Tax=Weeksella virosa (strain ATCC 43766 / DSM 16922 / JCM 21250 / CCUG 30538 / CDC 9751 / IAM 14551 / NBRC 16016 / NCTC 11634 / CL345/78) TaxID=865938 RepID=F0NZE3_WEEVC|nr:MULTISPECIES: YihY/virulence factor BrkB family protein [Weeksella]ADX68290.1 ribonuclease BN [Weeksella virosa DSM 16922]MDK7374607.1 YihY/virulence factor BrkB family protein [Weeksella virosa]MDK7674755.1 YihY/virulence factor BrkB family protein [Weeksella virosa]OFM83203.1 ribonuclease BN [Weeksella sp. HMSC059D05]SUP54603.1 YihY family inner membrane protein [Weeksella virosa]